MKDAFRTLVSRMPADGTIVAAVGHPGVGDVVSSAACRVRRLRRESEAGAGLRASECARDLRGARGPAFELVPHGAERGAGARRCTAQQRRERARGDRALDALGVPAPRRSRPLASVPGVKRRQEIRGEARRRHGDRRLRAPSDGGARHASRRCARAFPKRRLVAVFEPRTNTSRRAVFQDDYAVPSTARTARSFDSAGDAHLQRHRRGHRVLLRRAAGRRPARARSRRAGLAGVDDIVEHLADTCEGDVVLVMSNGAFGDIWEKLLEALGA